MYTESVPHYGYGAPAAPKTDLTPYENAKKAQ
jgi:hypothetical protein